MKEFKEKKGITKKEINKIFKKIGKFNKYYECQKNKYSINEQANEEMVWIVTDSSSSFNNIRELTNG